jgi:hypothetical protein
VSPLGIGIVGARFAAELRATNDRPPVARASLNPNNTLTVYAPDGAVRGDEHIPEKVETKAGWRFPSPEEDWMRGYRQELEGFVDAIREGREPLPGRP